MVYHESEQALVVQRSLCSLSCTGTTVNIRGCTSANEWRSTLLLFEYTYITKHYTCIKKGKPVPLQARGAQWVPGI